MNACRQWNDVAQAVRSGQWPQGVPAELREHVAACARCSGEVRILSAFGAAREVAMRNAPTQSAALLWWRAQLQRRREAVERLERPGWTIPAVAIAASVILLIAVMATAWKRIEWSRLLTLSSLTSWNAWMAVSVAILLCAFGAVAVMAGLGLSEHNR